MKPSKESIMARSCASISAGLFAPPGFACTVPKPCLPFFASVFATNSSLVQEILSARLAFFYAFLTCTCGAVLSQFPTVLAAIVAQDIDPPVVGAHLEVVVVLAEPAVEYLHDLAFFRANVKPQGPLPRPVPVIGFHTDLHCRDSNKWFLTFFALIVT